eukprot:2731624-Amphidinium_carterae.1
MGVDVSFTRRDLARCGCLGGTLEKSGATVADEILRSGTYAQPAAPLQDVHDQSPLPSGHMRSWNSP